MLRVVAITVVILLWLAPERVYDFVTGLKYSLESFRSRPAPKQVNPEFPRTVPGDDGQYNLPPMAASGVELTPSVPQ